MPYKDKEHNKEYMRQYFSNPEHRTKHNKQQKEHKQRLYNEIRMKLDNKCKICKRVGITLHAHEIHGQHKKEEKNPNCILKHIDDFILLCKPCHDTVHRYHLFKKEIEELDKLLEKVY
jgi:hypothetical protein